MHKSKVITAILFIAAAVLSVFTMSGCVNIHVYPQQPVVRDGEIPVPMAGHDNNGSNGAINIDPNMCIKPKAGTGAPGDVKTPSGDIEYR